eukprot:7653998-Pyramimonas_sp.AAC.1
MVSSAPERSLDCGPQDRIACLRLTDGSNAALPTWYWYGPGAPPTDKAAVDPAVVETLSELRRQWSGGR